MSSLASCSNTDETCLSSECLAGSRGRQASADSVHPLEPASPLGRPDPTIHEALQEGLLDTAASDNNLNSTGKIIVTGGSVSNMLDSGKHGYSPSAGLCKMAMLVIRCDLVKTFCVLHILAGLVWCRDCINEPACIWPPIDLNIYPM